MIGSANARWKVTVSIRIFEVLQVLTSRRAIDEDAGSAIAIQFGRRVINLIALPQMSAFSHLL